MSLPQNLRYSKEHTWVQKVSEQEAVIGITEFAQGELGEIVYVNQPATGASFAKDEVFGSIEAVKTVSDLFMPITGEITALNEKLVNEPTLINTDPFGEGWIIKVKIVHPQELEATLNADDYLKITA